FTYAQQLTNINPETALAIVAVYQEEQQETFVGVIRYAKENVQDRTAEFAITVRDDFQQRKIGTHLLHLLIEEAKNQEVDFLTGIILPSNTGVVKLLKKAGEKVSFTNEGVQTCVHIDVRST
ncbi:MAG: GNAT family N-acetyltransferase, partial [Bacteroidota bacterium]